MEGVGVGVTIGRGIMPAFSLTAGKAVGAAVGAVAGMAGLCQPVARPGPKMWGMNSITLTVQKM